MSFGDIFAGGFDVQSNFEEEQSFDLIPEIKDCVMIVDSAEVKSTQNGGTGLNLKIQIVDEQVYGGQYNGRFVFEWINIAHPTSEQAVNIGKATLARYAAAMGLVSMSSELDLLSKPFVGTVSQRKDKKSGEMRQIIKGVRSQGNMMQTSAPQMQQQPQQAPQQIQQQAPTQFQQPQGGGGMPFAGNPQANGVNPFLKEKQM